MKDYINNNFGTQIPINPPKIDFELGEITHKIVVESVENVDDAILKNIIEVAEEKDATILVLLNKKYIYDALDKQRAKKVKPITGYKTIKSCPVCDNEVTLSSNYCRKCGQKLDWED